MVLNHQLQMGSIEIFQLKFKHSNFPPISLKSDVYKCDSLRLPNGNWKFGNNRLCAERFSARNQHEPFETIR